MKLETNIPLLKFNTFGIDALAENFIKINDVDDLGEAIDFKNKMPPGSSLILGGGSNILLTKKAIRFVIKNDIPCIEKIREDADYIYLKAGAGENWHRFVLYCLDHNYAGVENLALIPGNIGASPIQNIGAYGVEIKDVFHSLEAFHLADRKMVSFDAAACEFDYRESVFKNRYKGQFIITSVIFKLRKKPVLNIAYGAIKQELEAMQVTEPNIQAVAGAVINIRRSKLPDPAVTGNAGSFFKNPEITLEKFQNLQAQHPGIVGYPLQNGQVKLAAGWLIEQCGWKGYRKGDAGCHPKQALVLVNYGHASGKEIYDLSTEMLESVEKKFSVCLQREVNII